MRRYAEFLLFLTTFIWASTFVATKIALVDVSPLFFILLRFAIASAISFSIWHREIVRLDLPTFKKGTILSLLLGSGFILQVYGLEYTTASKSAFVTGMLVVFTPIAQVLIERRAPKAGNLVGVALVTFGLWLLTSPKGSSFNVGDALTLGAAVSYALYIVYLDVFTRQHSVVQLFFLQLFLILVLTIPATFLFESVVFQPTTTAVVVILYLVVFATVISAFIQTKYQKESSPTRAAVIFSLEPVIAAVMAYLILQERMPFTAVVGGGIIVAGILVSQLSESLKKIWVWIGLQAEEVD